ncbi:DNA-binding protein [Caulobacter phage Sansa]|uniref:DNA-binding protein n=1 Tax=Caulobacter phage Sansa TaxID=1675600 RepID=A0A0K1LLU8_9CAUD|nr:DNA-binding protein [Caulobacter phage Sansa]AKU43476.1 DNA-binding protein [Caulobacter phage Sansa]
MSHIEKARAAIKAAAFDLGVPELARRAGVPENTARRLIKKPPAAVTNLISLEREALKHEAETKK